MSPRAWHLLVPLACFAAAFGLSLAPGQEKNKPKKFALLVGVSKYNNDDTFTALRYTENDVDQLAAILEKVGFSVRVLTNTLGKKNERDLPSAANIKKAIDELVEGKLKDDTILVALSGHGANVEVKDPDEKGKPKEYPYFCPYDASTLGISYSTGRSKFLINLNLDLFDKLEAGACGAGQKLVLVDACRNQLDGKDATRSFAAEKVTIPGGVGVLFSCSKGQRAWETPKFEHGVFFHFVLEGLRGKAARPGQAVTWKLLTNYVNEEVESWVPTHIGNGAKQTPHELGNIQGGIRLVPASVLPREAPPLAKDSPKPNETPIPVPPKSIRVAESRFEMDLVRLPETGSKGFPMGSTEGEREAVQRVRQSASKAKTSDELPPWLVAEGPRHTVVLSRSSYLGKYEVTQSQWKALMGYNPSCFSLDGKGKPGVEYNPKVLPAGDKEKLGNLKQTDQFPVENVSWDDVQDFLQKLNALAKRKGIKGRFRLPTEAEWEYACRGGSTGDEPFNLNGRPSKSLGHSQANFDSRFPFGGGTQGKKLDRPCEVGSYNANAFGQYDMHGNVWEWVQDWYDEAYYKRSEKENPQGPGQRAKQRVMRGGSYEERGYSCRAATRSGEDPKARFRNVGFRVAFVPDP